MCSTIKNGAGLWQNTKAAWSTRKGNQLTQENGLFSPQTLLQPLSRGWQPGKDPPRLCSSFNIHIMSGHGKNTTVKAGDNLIPQLRKKVTGIPRLWAEALQTLLASVPHTSRQEVQQAVLGSLSRWSDFLSSHSKKWQWGWHIGPPQYFCSLHTLYQLFTFCVIVTGSVCLKSPQTDPPDGIFPPMVHPTPHSQRTLDYNRPSGPGQVHKCPENLCLFLAISGCPSGLQSHAPHKQVCLPPNLTCHCSHFSFLMSTEILYLSHSPVWLHHTKFTSFVRPLFLWPWIYAGSNLLVCLVDPPMASIQ